GLGGEAAELVLGEELRDRRADLAAVVHEGREALGAPLLPNLFETPELRPRVRAGRDDVAHHLRVCEDAELRAARELRRVLDLEAVAKVGLVGAVTAHDIRVRQPLERRLRDRAPGRLAARDDTALEDVEYVFAVDERHLEIELPELELP